MNTRTVRNLRHVVNDYLKRNDLFSEDAPWEIIESALGGFGVVAKRDIDAGEVIFLDAPVILGPRCALNTPKICVSCFTRNDLKNCKNNCGLPVCSEECQNSFQHNRECKLIRQIRSSDTSEGDSNKLLKCLAPIRSLLLSEENKEVVRLLKSHKGQHHGYEVDLLINELRCEIKEDDEVFMRIVCSVLDANAFEVIIGNESSQSSLRGLYPLGSLANHRCFPNTMHVYDDKRRMVVRASVFIPKGCEIFHSYTRIIWGTPVRLYKLLKTKHFFCKCARCCDPTEFGTYMSSIYCKKCKGKVIPVNPLKMECDWTCEDCKNVMAGAQVGEFMMILGSALKSCDNDGVPEVLKFLNGKILNLVPETNQIVVEIKSKALWTLGHSEGFTWKELPTELLYVKKKFCEDILSLLEKLRTGMCKMRGLVLFELYECSQELNSRVEKPSYETFQEAQRYLDEAAEILKYDVSAPDVIVHRRQHIKRN